MNTTTRNQDANILRALERAKRNLLIERCDGVWHVEVEGTDDEEPFWCEGHTLPDALANVATVLLAAPGAWIHDGPDDIDEPIALELEPLVEYCEPLAPVVEVLASA